MTWQQTFRTIEAVLAATPEDRRADVQVALASDRSAEAMSAELAKRGHQVSPSTIRTYRRHVRQTGETNR